MCGKICWNFVICGKSWLNCVMCGKSWWNCVICGADLVELCRRCVPLAFNCEELSNFQALL